MWNKKQEYSVSKPFDIPLKWYNSIVFLSLCVSLRFILSHCICKELCRAERWENIALHGLSSLTNFMYFGANRSQFSFIALQQRYMLHFGSVPYEANEPRKYLFIEGMVQRGSEFLYKKLILPCFKFWGIWKFWVELTGMREEENMHLRNQ